MAAGGVWVFRKDGVMELERQESSPATSQRGKALVYVPANETMRSLAALERRLGSLGWERYYEDRAIVQLHKRGGVDLISIPRDFSRLRSTHMYDVVVKNRDQFKVVDL
ncbi:flowering-promoting factor 1-like protein 5 [Triticum aestivum]|uniref:flowering-promoting factor 1-like protein 5 n=1 Tax=Triticum aestivum TaxID=4565 RepID=UPI001D031215|nr:flowering-promoting factor 1-like protein 5 [Triticum aestivum]